LFNSGNLVTGNWNPEKQLVELHKELVSN